LCAIVDEVPGGEVVGAVEDQVVTVEQVDGVVPIKPDLIQMDAHQRVDLGDRVARGLGFGPTDIADAVDDLTLQIRLLDDVVVHDADRADPGRGQVEQRWRAETACADHQHPRILEPLLAVDAEIGEEEVAAIAGHLIGVQLAGRLDKRR
jgi:hypothetical protein